MPDLVTRSVDVGDVDVKFGDQSVDVGGVDV